MDGATIILPHQAVTLGESIYNGGGAIAMIEKLSKQRYSANLFDVTQDIIGALPLKLVEQWLSTDQTYDDARKLLANYQVKGYSVSSDSVGLTKLCQQEGLLEILVMINQPKKIVYAYGKAIAGESVGIWAADNTQMFYPESVDAQTLVSMLLTIQDEINRTCRIKIGLGAHYGNYYQISGGLYGNEANAIEEVAEDYTDGGEILISQAICDRLPDWHNFVLERRDDLPEDLIAEIGSIYRVLDGDRLDNVKPSESRYPIPYSEEFYEDLLIYESRLGDEDFANSLTAKYVQQKVVVLIECKSAVADLQEITMFNQLSFSALMKDIGLRLIDPQTKAEIKVISSLGIYAFDDAIAALNFAMTFREELTKQSVTCRIGIDYGEVLIFDLALGTRDIAGSPVNVASKMAQDRGEFGKLYLSAGVKDMLSQTEIDLSQFHKITYEVSEVEITAYEG